MSSKDTHTGSIVAQRWTVESSQNQWIKWKMDNNGSLKGDTWSSIKNGTGNMKTEGIWKIMSCFMNNVIENWHKTCKDTEFSILYDI